MLVCFFFQAEDGIRDDLVTGVQTCALPISRSRVPPTRLLAREGRWTEPLLANVELSIERDVVDEADTADEDGPAHEGARPRHGQLLEGRGVGHAHVVDTRPRLAPQHLPRRGAQRLRTPLAGLPRPGRRLQGAEEDGRGGALR